MNRKMGPYFLLGSLFVLLVFILGVKYGKKVEITNKKINFLLSITPSKAPIPTQPISFKTFKNDGCGVQFLYPESFKVLKNSSVEASLEENDSEILRINCEKTGELQTKLSSSTQPKEDIKFKNLTPKAVVDPKDSQKRLFFQIRNGLSGKQIYIMISRNFFPLFESTLQYLP